MAAGPWETPGAGGWALSGSAGAGRSLWKPLPWKEKLSPELVTARTCKCKKLYGDNSAQEDLLNYGLSQLFREDGVHKESSETQKQRLGAFLRRIGGGTRFGGKILLKKMFHLL